jgi:DNA-binding NarL/FixJ family response regulator
MDGNGSRQGEGIRVVVADDHDLFRRGLRDLLEAQGIRVVGEARDGDEALRLAAHVVPDVVVMDVNMPRLSGIEVTRQLADAAPDVRVLILTISAGDADVIDAILAGASGYLLKDASMEDIAVGVKAAARGESLISPRIAAKLLERVRSTRYVGPGRQSELSKRELEILRLMAAGCENAEIGRQLVISPRTVKNHISSILTKLQLDNRIQAAVYAVRCGLD